MNKSSHDIPIADQHAVDPGADAKEDGTLNALLSAELDVVHWPTSRSGSISAWWGHVPFAHWVVKSSRPRLIVELGTHTGVSYSAFCEAVLREGLTTRCFAVDTWIGDEHAGQYSEHIFNELSEFNRSHYKTFSTLVRSTFDDALHTFDDGSIDLLHIDGLHTYEAVKHDFETWLPKMSDRGIVLFHDTNVHERDFGVWQLWEELGRKYRGFEFLHSHGLGVLLVGSHPPEAVEALLELDPRASAKIRERFSDLGDRWTASCATWQISEQIRNREQELVNEIEANGRHLASVTAEIVQLKNDLGVQVANSVARISQLTSENADSANLISQLTIEKSANTARISQLVSEKSAAAAQIASLTSKLHDAVHAEALARNEVNVIRQSTLWRAFDPLRGAIDRMPLLRRTIRRGVKAAWWTLTPHRMPARIAFLRNRSLTSPVPAPAAAPARPEVVASIVAPERSFTIDREVLYRVDRLDDIAGQDIVVLVCYCPAGRLTRLQAHLIQEYHDAGYLVALVVNSGCASFHRNVGDSAARIQIVRENIGFDFGAWRHAIRLIGGLGSARSITFANDSIVVKPGGIAVLRRRVEETKADVVFATMNTERRPHLQSFFFTIGSPSAASASLDYLAALPYYVDKDILIDDIELHLSDRIAQSGLTAEVAYPCEGAVKGETNPTIHNWRALVLGGCPFLKVQLFTLGFESTSDQDVRDLLGDHVVTLLEEHLHQRSEADGSSGSVRNVPATPALNIPALFDENGVQQAFNPPLSRFPTLVLPLEGLEQGGAPEPRVLCIVHCFYLDLATDILRGIAETNFGFKILLTTDTDEKRSQLCELLDTFHLSGDVVVCPNRGRDVAPFIIEGARHIDEAELILHIHTKKSPHSSRYAGWGEYVQKNLLGSKEIVRSVYALFEDSRVGIVYSDHYDGIIKLRNWGYDFAKAKALLDRLGVDVSADDLLEFPTSTMFWARKEAIEPLFHLGLDYEDFDEEHGQIDGTLAHAVERSLLFLAESRGYSHVSVAAHDRVEHASGELMQLATTDVAYHLDRRSSRLLGTSGRRAALFTAVQEIYPVAIAKSASIRPRLNLLLPTARPQKTYGGVSSALRCASQILQHSPGVDLRIVITSDSVDRESLDALSHHFRRSCLMVEPDDDVAAISVVAMAERRMIPLAIRDQDVFLATAWWTADLGFRLLRDQRKIFARERRLLYLVQDYEPAFYAWSTHYALAEATYRHGAETIALINSEELAEFMSERFTFSETYVVPYVLNEQIAARLNPTRKEPIILVYGRPSVERNAFPIIREGLRQWQASKPHENCRYRIIFAGEDFGSDLVREVENSVVVGKLSLDDYADLLNRSAIGLSLMISPHPSYPPLEMASAGCITITNSYEAKDLSRRSDRIISLGEVTVEAVAAALEIAKARVDLIEAYEPSGLTPLTNTHRTLDFSKLAPSIFLK